MSFLLFALIWFGIGLLVVIMLVYGGWQDGTDLTLYDCLPLLGGLAMGPLTLAIVLYDAVICMCKKLFSGKLNKDMVILPGSKSAKAYKILREKDWPPN